MTKKTWEESEIELFKQNNNDYYKNCADCAFYVYETMIDDEHNGETLNTTFKILQRLVRRLPLTPITKYDFENIEEEFIDKNNPNVKIYRCPRMSSLSKKVSDDNITYSDINRTIFVDEDTGQSWSNGLSNEIVDSKFPITLPYNPSVEKFKVYGRDVYIDENGVDVSDQNPGLCNRIYFDYILTPDGKTVDLKYWINL